MSSILCRSLFPVLKSFCFDIVYQLSPYLHWWSVVYFVDAFAGCSSSKYGREDLQAHGDQVGPGRWGHGVGVEIVAFVGTRGGTRVENHLHNCTWKVWPSDFIIIEWLLQSYAKRFGWLYFLPSMLDHENPPSEMELVWMSSKSSRATFFSAFGFSANLRSSAICPCDAGTELL